MNDLDKVLDDRANKKNYSKEVPVGFLSLKVLGTCPLNDEKAHTCWKTPDQRTRIES